MYSSGKFVSLQEICTPSGNLCPLPEIVHQHEICTPKFVPLLKNLYTKMKYHEYPEYCLKMALRPRAQICMLMAIASIVFTLLIAIEAEKSVLVTFGRRNRIVTFYTGLQSDKSSLTAAVRTTFRDVIKDNSSSR